jgi:outer membrane protein TolC
LETASRVREKTLIKYREGVAGSFELTQAENQLLDAQSQYVQSMIQLINAHSALNKILGNYNN